MITETKRGCPHKYCKKHASNHDAGLARHVSQFRLQFAFADGHSEIHKWLDGRTRETSSHQTTRLSPQGNRDNQELHWLQQLTSALARYGNRRHLRFSWNLELFPFA
jgi:prepilin-type processing-associated H-X9-DG protein